MPYYAQPQMVSGSKQKVQQNAFPTHLCTVILWRSEARVHKRSHLDRDAIASSSLAAVAFRHLAHFLVLDGRQRTGERRREAPQVPFHRRRQLRQWAGQSGSAQGAKHPAEHADLGKFRAQQNRRESWPHTSAADGAVARPVLRSLIVRQSEKLQVVRRTRGAPHFGHHRAVSTEGSAGQSSRAGAKCRRQRTVEKALSRVNERVRAESWSTWSATGKLWGPCACSKACVGAFLAGDRLLLERFEPAARRRGRIARQSKALCRDRAEESLSRREGRLDRVTSCRYGSTKEVFGEENRREQEALDSQAFQVPLLQPRERGRVCDGLEAARRGA
eukprot:scaffold4614_cov247-Pinguiococcus_pyrenoidosus.AAC.2